MTRDLSRPETIVDGDGRRLRYLFDTRSGSTPSSGTEDYWDGDISWITPDDLGKLDGRDIVATRRTLTVEGYENSGAVLAPSGSLVLSKRAPIGQAAILRIEAACNQGCFLLLPKPYADERFYYYCLVAFRPLIEILGRGSTFMELSTDDLRSFRLPHPTLPVQQRIADYLDRETAEIDALIAEKGRMLALLEEKRAALVTHAVTRGLDPDVPLKPSGLDWLGDVPEHWEVMQLKRTWSSSEYGISESIRDEGGIRVLRMSCITKDGLIDLSNAGQVGEVPESLLLHEGDILFNRTNSLDQIAKVGWLPEEPDAPTSFASYLVRLRVNERVSQEYLVALLNSRDFLAFARSNAIPAIGQANLSPSRYGDIEIPLPPIDEQSAIVAHLGVKIARSKRLEYDLQVSIDLLKERRSALITAAVTGQIPVEEMAE